MFFVQTLTLWGMSYLKCDYPDIEDDECIGTARYSNTIHTLWTILSVVVDGDILLEVTQISNRLYY